MQSIFDEEDAVYGYATQLGPLVKRTPGNMPVFVSVNTSMTYRVKDKSKRTVYEALSRIYEADPPDLEGLGLYALARPTRKPFMIYNASRVLAAGLVIIDPLDRLEGGLID